MENCGDYALATPKYRSHSFKIAKGQVGLILIMTIGMIFRFLGRQRVNGTLKEVLTNHLWKPHSEPSGIKSCLPITTGMGLHFAAWRPSTATCLYLKLWLLRTTQFGVAGDKPVYGDFDGDGKSDIAVIAHPMRPGTFFTAAARLLQ